MRQMTISQVSKQFGLRTSALRYYEQIGLLPPAQRVSGRRAYDVTVLRRLALIQRARQVGFSLGEIHQLFSGFRPGTPASHRWRQLSERKLMELDASVERIKIMQTLLKRMGACRCEALDECGEGLLKIGCGESPAAATTANG